MDELTCGGVCVEQHTGLMTMNTSWVISDKINRNVELDSDLQKALLSLCGECLDDYRTRIGIRKFRGYKK